MSTGTSYDGLAGRLRYNHRLAEAVKVSPESFDLEGIMDKYHDALNALDAVVALCRDTDGNYLPGEAAIPVGEFTAAVARYMLTD